MIRKIQTEDIDDIMQIWRNGNLIAHNFINSKYWFDNYEKVKNEYLPKADTWIYIENNDIKGFISILYDQYIGALFVEKEFQRDGIGTILIKHCKNLYNNLSLKVYKKNAGAIAFYKEMGFKNISSQIDKDTNELEYIMKWNKK